ncbi:MAG: hypothetical protein KJ622_09385 [Alphaproteobacteria bacterium]|nr:hypothetical protein [Alphaproteobacteria bacterium]
MSSKSPDAGNGWFASFLALFTGQPSNRRNSLNATATASAGEKTEIAVSLAPIQLKKSPDWNKAREMRLAARLAVNTRMNRPKLVATRTRAGKPAGRPVPQFSRGLKSASKPAVEMTSSAVVIAFPTQAPLAVDLTAAA